MSLATRLLSACYSPTTRVLFSIIESFRLVEYFVDRFIERFVERFVERFLRAFDAVLSSVCQAFVGRLSSRSLHPFSKNNARSRVIFENGCGCSE